MRFIVAVGGGLLAAWFFYWRLEGLGRRGWAPAIFRGLAITLLLVLALDFGWTRREAARGRPLVVLDASLSMSAAGSHWEAARDSAAAWGEVRRFGDEGAAADTLPSMGKSDLRPALAAASALGRRVVVVSDGELTDAGELEPDLLEGVTVRLFPRDTVAGVAVSRVDGPAVVAAGDSARFEVELARFGGAADTAGLELRAGGRVLVRRPVRFQGSGSRRITIEFPTRGLKGEVTIEVAVSSPDDRELRDNSRWAVLKVLPTPGVVILASPPDWDSRTLHRTLREVADLPVRGFVEMEQGVWRDAETLQRVDPAVVQRASRAADLLVLKGRSGLPAAGANPRGLWLWPGGASRLSGEWYAESRAGSPVSDAFAGLPVDSFPPLGPITSVEPAADEWVGLVARLGRRGAERPVYVGRERGNTRQVLTAADGLWRWRFRGGASETSYRSLVAATVSWLVQGPGSGGPVRLVAAVVPNGRPLTFQWNVKGPPRAVAARFTGTDTTILDTLRFDAAGQALARLPAGQYRYLAEESSGVAVIEGWSSEFLPHPVVLRPREGSGGAATRPVSLRHWIALFGACIAFFGLEWFARRRLGLR